MEDIVDVKLARLSGRRISAAEKIAVLEALPWAPQSILDLMERYPMAGAKLSLDETDDESGLGAALRWFTPEEMIDEATNTYPGIAAARRHYFPVGECLIGTGDPYFVAGDNTDAPIFRIPHTSVAPNDLLVEDQLERVSSSLREFIRAAQA